LIFTFILGYITLNTPLRVISRYNNKNHHEGDLLGQPLCVFGIAELSLRQLLFYCFYILHSSAYFFGIGIHLPRIKQLRMFIYRIGCNESYALVYSLFSILCFLFYQYLNYIDLYAGLLIQQVSRSTFLIFGLLLFFVGIIGNKKNTFYY